jgi:glutathione S-transferase
MKLYDFHAAPNPRRVRIFAAEKGIEIPTVQIDLRDGGQNTDEFGAVNPRRAVPVLELDDGTLLFESVAICRYLEESHPEPALMGKSPLEKATVEMWHRRVELEGLAPCADALRNHSKFFDGRALPGPVSYEQIPALSERGHARIGHFFTMLDARLQESAFVAGPDYTIADIAGLIAVDFAGWVKETPPESATALKAWHEKVSARPSAKA